MKRILSKRSGFTLVEIIVAFAVFALMAAMLTSMLGLAINQRQFNNDLEHGIEKQKLNLASQEKVDTYSTNDGAFKFSFGGTVGDLSMNYTAVSSSSDSSDNVSIDYFIGNTNYKSVVTPKPGGDGSGDGMSLTSKVDSRIYGSANFDYVKVKMEKITDMSTVEGITVPAGATLYQISAYAVEEDGYIKSHVDTLLARNFKMKFPDAVLDFGYYGTDPTEGKYISYLNSEFTDDTWVVKGATNNHYSITQTTGNTLRVTMPQVAIANNIGDAIPPKYAIFTEREDYNMPVYYVVLAGTSNYNTTIFGDNGTVDADGFTVFEPYVETSKDDKGVTKTTTHINVYGAFPKAATPETPETPESEESDES